VSARLAVARKMDGQEDDEVPALRLVVLVVGC